MNFSVDVMKPGDWPQVAMIYLNGIQTKIATFQSDVPNWEEWDSSHCRACRLVARSGDAIRGWAALSPVSNRCAYAGVAEVSVYVGEAYTGKGAGTALLTALIKCAEAEGYWTLQSSIIEENTASRALHKKCGFREVGVREKLGKMDSGIWHNVVLMERRSKSVGV